jgi:hypothetical protein
MNLNKPLKPMSPLFPLYAVLGGQILGIAIGSLINLISDYQIKEHEKPNEKPKLAITEVVYKDSNFNPQKIINGYDLDNNGSIDKIIKKESYEAGRFGKLYKTFEYFPNNKEFSKLNEILKDNKSN